MTCKLLIIGGGILGMMSASAAAKAGGFSEIIVTEPRTATCQRPTALIGVRPTSLSNRRLFVC